jgi:hypothetical protein
MTNLILLHFGHRFYNWDPTINNFKAPDVNVVAPENGATACAIMQFGFLESRYHQ